METVKNRVVIKVGTSTITTETGENNFRTMDKLAQVLSGLANEGYEVILVSSGAIAVGANKMGLQQKPKELKLKQAAASVGQCELMHLYDKFFSEYGKMVSQILLSGDDVENPVKKQNLRNTFFTLIEHNIIPIVNENDPISTDQIQEENFGDNDTLSANVAELVKADLLILLSDINGLYTDDPRTNPAARFVHTVNRIDEELEKMGKGAGSAVGTGGMATKIEAAKIATEAGADMVIANGDNIYAINDIMAGKKVGTLFLAKNHRYDGENELGPERDAYRMERRLKRNIQYRMAVGK